MTTHTHTEAQTAIESGTEMFVPLNKLKKSPKNARKTPHGEAAIEALAASIAAKGMLQNLVVESELNADGGETGFYFVTIGEGRRLAQVLRASRKQIKKSEPIRCVLDTANDPHEISLDENVTRTNMHPADQFEAFQRLVDERGYGAEEIAARFGVTPQIVRQRLRLGAVSPKLMQVYRDGGLTLDQLSAFAISEDHARQEQVYGALSWNKEPAVIRRGMTESHVRASDRRALFVGADAYAEAGGVILRDLFSEDGGGYFQDAVLLDRLTLEKLVRVADEVRAEGWKWAQAFLDYPHAHGLRRAYPQQVDLSPEDQERLTALQAQFDALSAAYEREDVLPPEVEADYNALEAEIEQLSARRFAYDADAVARGGVFVLLNHDGTARIERGFIRPEDEAPAPEIEGGDEGADAVAGDDETGEDEDGEASGSDLEDDEAEDGKPLSDLLVRDLTAHRTLGLRLALGEQPDMALFAHCAALTVFAVKQPWERKPQVLATADKLAAALSLDMAALWRPTVRSYFGRVTKAHILSAVREHNGAETAERMAGMKKEPMAAYAEGLLAPSGWLPDLLRTPQAPEPAMDETEPAYAHAAE
jgi:ParB family chromosome partitioning protein